MYRLTFWMALLLLIAPAMHGQNIELQAELLAPLGTNISNTGDPVMARVISPPAFAGDTLEGRVTESKAGGRQASLRFTFETLKHGSEEVPVSTEITSITNSKGEANKDEEGRSVRRNNVAARTAARAGFGAALGGLTGGRRGAAVGAVSEASHAANVIEFSSDAPSVRFGAGSRVVVSAKSRGGRELASLTPNVAPAAAPAAPAAVAVAPVTAPKPATTTPGQPDLTTIKADFVAGSRTIFYDDFTDMAGDEPPPHWRVRGGSVGLKTGPGIRQMSILTGETVTLTPNLKGIPANFTLETELKFDDPNDRRVVWYIHDGSWQGPTGRYAALEISTRAWENQLQIDVDHHYPKHESLANAKIQVDFSQPVKQNFWIQNGRLRIYVNGERVVDVNQVTLPQLEGAALYAEYMQEKLGIRFARFAESAPDFSQIINSSGRYVTHGILFDTDSDRLKPESASVIRLVARAMESNPNLKLRVEGHTDSSGNAAHNLDLSKRRAEAVKNVLVPQFGVSAERLTTEGIGDAKPLESNDTPKGRAQHRRVEFARL